MAYITSRYALDFIIDCGSSFKVYVKNICSLLGSHRLTPKQDVKYVEDASFTRIGNRCVCFSICLYIFPIKYCQCHGLISLTCIMSCIHDLGTNEKSVFDGEFSEVVVVTRWQHLDMAPSHT